MRTDGGDAPLEGTVTVEGLNDMAGPEGVTVDVRVTEPEKLYRLWTVRVEVVVALESGVIDVGLGTMTNGAGEFTDRLSVLTVAEVVLVPVTVTV